MMSKIKLEHNVIEIVVYFMLCQSVIPAEPKATRFSRAP